ncbi:MAG: Wzz/FepE/Etk N-terminal domain-containing protein [Candidatus Marinimicrobia bacterium]|jgi:uncharacterized protein involved in exopolysaccharide biosynthesis|nr:Wzz/FepE/Etk N-terminal domain-containing protein [Candidatus Neomarinimicrobiota bacterium]
MQTLTDHEKKILELVKKHPEILDNPAEREKIAKENSMTEKTLRNRIADLKRYGLVDSKGVNIKRTSEKEVIDKTPTDDSVVQVLWNRRRFLLINFIAVSVLSVIVSLLLPVWYASSFTILPSSAGGDIFGTVGGGTGALSLIGLGNTSEETNNYISILNSRRLRERIIDEFNLRSLYGAEEIEDVLDQLEANTDIEVSDEGALMFVIYDRDSIRCKKMADLVLDELGKTSIDLKTKTGIRNQKFILARIESLESELRESENSLRDFTLKHNAYELPIQLTESVGQLIGLEVKLAEAEIAYNVAESTLNKDSPSLRVYRLQKDELRTQLKELKAGWDEGSLFPNLSEAPDMLLAYARMKREIEINSAVLEFLYPQYEQARLQEARDEPSLQILDFPRVPQKKAKPQRALIVVGAVAFSFLLACFWVLLRNRVWLSAPIERKAGAA